MAVDFTRPVLLRAFNALPLSRTPWAGQDIHRLFSTDTQQGAAVPSLGECGEFSCDVAKSAHANLTAPPRLGECWEFSCDPQYPSRLASTHTRLDTAIAANPRAALSAAQVAQHGPYCQLLVKLINAARPLSVQLHPPFSQDTPLAGKWESWLVLTAAQDSKAYVGFETTLNRAQLREKINTGTLAEHLATLALREDSYLEIPPCTVHALGAGAVVLEVQHLLQGRGGETLRLWDWGHKYNEAGELDPQHGRARPLALARALPLLEPATQTRDQLHAHILPTAQNFFAKNGVKILQRSNNPYYRLFTVQAEQRAVFALSISDGYGIMLCWHGTWQLGQTEIIGYQPLFLPAELGKIEVMCEKNSTAALIVPRGAHLACQ